MLPFIRKDLAQLRAYTPHPGGSAGEPAQSASSLDRLDTNENPYDLPDDLKQKLTWTYQQEIEANRYPDGGHAALKEAIAEYVNSGLGTGDWGLGTGNSQSLSLMKSFITPDNISVGNGSDELIRSLLIATCLGGEGSILVANPTFSMYGILAQTLGIPVISVGRSPANFEIDLVAAQKAIDSSQNPPVRVVFVVHPNSPTANALTSNELNWLRNLPPHILAVIDEAYFEFSQTTLVGELQQRSNWVVLRTFSKAFRLAAHRVGYAIASPEIISVLEKIRLPYNLPSFTQAAARVALANRQLLLGCIPQILADRDRLSQALAEMPMLQIWPSDANFIYLRLKGTEAIDDALNQLTQQLKQQGTLVRHTGGGLRLTVGSPEENARSIQRLQAILKGKGEGEEQKK